MRRPAVLFVTHGWRGGVDRHLRDLAALIADRCDVVVLEPASRGVVQVSWRHGDRRQAAWFRLPADSGDLGSLLGGLGVVRVHYHHVHRLPPEVLSLPAALGLPYDCTLHDYYPVCPQYHLADPQGRYCGEPDAAGCNRCIARRPPTWALDIGAWRATFSAFLAAADRVIAPSRDVAQRVGRYFPALSIRVWPHPEFLRTPAPAPLRVLLIGTLTPEKGLWRLVDLASDATRRSLPLAYVVLGSVAQALPERLPVTVRGQYDDEQLASLIAAERADVIAFPAQMPESYSYTLTAAIVSGLPIVASRLGALVERLETLERATLLAWNAPVQEWSAALIAAARAREDVAAGSAPGSLAAATDERAASPASAGDPAQYRERYLEPIPPGIPKRAAPLLDPRFLEPPRESFDSRELSLTALFDGGVLCGHLESRRQLARRVREVDDALALIDDEPGGEIARVSALLGRVREGDERAQSLTAHLDHARGELEQARQELERARAEVGAARAQHASDLARLDSDVAAARARIREIETSTTWRLTGPVRRAVHAMRVARASSGTGLRRLPGYASVAREVLRTQGARALARRAYDKLSGRRRYRPAGTPHYGLAEGIGRLTLRTVDERTKPRASIVIPVHGNHLHTFSCLESLVLHPSQASFEVLVVDDAGPGPASAVLAGVSGVRFVRNDINLGFVGTCNRGAALARGDVVVFLNNDTLVTEGWLDAMLRLFDADPKVGVVGAKLVFPDGRLQEAGGMVWRDGSAWNFGRNGDPSRPECCYVREVDYCSGACLAVRRDLFESLGGFDTRYAPAYYEDTDLAFAARAAGYRVLYQPAATVVHFEGATSGTDETAGVKRHQVANRAAFADKWASVLASHRPNGHRPDLEKDRWARRRVLVIDACMLTPDRDSGSLRMATLLEELRSLDCKVTFVAESLEHREPYVSALQQAGIEVLFHPYVSSIDSLLAARGPEFDVIIASRQYVAEAHVDAISRLAPQALLVFDTVDLHFLREERLAELQGSAVLRQAAKARRDAELALIRRCDVTLVVSEFERQLLARLEPGAEVMVVSNIHDVMPPGKPWAEREGILFVGGFRHPPNADGVLWYAREVLPLLRARLPGVATTVVGPDAPSSVRSLAADDFVVAGYVPDLAPMLGSVRVSISPLRYGAGVKGKVNLALAWGVPVVATSPSVEGMFLVDGRDVLIADSADDFADALVRAYQDEALWNRLSAAGRDNVRRHFSRDVARAALERLLAVQAGSRRVAA